MPAPTVAVPGEVSANQPAAVAYSAPRVSCQGNQLTVDAENASLGSVLAAVHGCLGVEITMPDGAAEDRSFVRLGPGPTREVLDELLSSTKYSYAIQSSPSVPGKISSILLIGDSKSTGNGTESIAVPTPATDVTSTPLRRAWLETVRNAKTEAGIVDTDPAAPSSSDGSVTASTTPNAGAGAVAGTGDSSSPSNAAGSSATAASPATPDAVAPPASTQAPASSSPSQPAQPTDELHDKIDQMQQLFEQRKKMAAGQSSPPS